MRDFIAVLGLGLIFGGAWWLSPPWSLVVLGGLLLMGAIAGHKTEDNP